MNNIITRIEERLLKEHGIHRMKPDPNCNYCKGTGERLFSGSQDLIPAWIPCYCAFSNPTTQPRSFAVETIRKLTREELWIGD